MFIKCRKTSSLSNIGCQTIKSHGKSDKHVRITTASTNQSAVMTYCSNDESQSSAELLLVSSEILKEFSTSSSGERPVTPFPQFAVQNDITKSDIL